MSEVLTIQSHQGPYLVNFCQNRIDFPFTEEELSECHFIIDAKVAELYQVPLSRILKEDKVGSVLLIDATEANKSLEAFPRYVEHLVKHKIRKSHRLIAIGGGIIQDICAFLAATLLRGVRWWFYPTTLLAQADSCIGSKSSVNCLQVKNILGTFTPPQQIFIHTEFLKTLNQVDFNSGVGEMLKVHAIASPDEFEQIAKDYDRLIDDDNLLIKYIKRSLEIKKTIIEQDEFDQHLRKIMNYGHTFGHAIESATNYRIPHGIAVTIGMDMANYIASAIQFGKKFYFDNMHPTLKKNYQHFTDVFIPQDIFFEAISSDKKNPSNNQLGVVLVNKNGKPTFTAIENNIQFQNLCTDYLLRGRLI